MGLNIKEREREAEARGTDEQPLSDKPPLTQRGETYELTACRKSHWSCSVKQDVLKNLTKFTGKHLWQSLFLNSFFLFRIIYNTEAYFTH